MAQSNSGTHAEYPLSDKLNSEPSVYVPTSDLDLQVGTLTGNPTDQPTCTRELPGLVLCLKWSDFKSNSLSVTQVTLNPSMGQ
jgi:hypothetical protein